MAHFTAAVYTLGFHVGLGASHGDTAAVVIPALHVAPGEGRSLGAAESGVGQHGHQGHVEPSPFLGLLGCFEAAAVLAELDGGEADHSEDGGGEDAGLALGL